MRPTSTTPPPERPRVKPPIPPRKPLARAEGVPSPTTRGPTASHGEPDTSRPPGSPQPAGSPHHPVGPTHPTHMTRRLAPPHAGTLATHGSARRPPMGWHAGQHGPACRFRTGLRAGRHGPACRFRTGRHAGRRTNRHADQRTPDAPTDHLAPPTCRPSTQARGAGCAAYERTTIGSAGRQRRSTAGDERTTAGAGRRADGSRRIDERATERAGRQIDDRVTIGRGMS